MDGVTTELECRGTCASPRSVLFASNSALLGVVAAYLATGSVAVAFIAATTALLMVALVNRHQRSGHAHH